MNSEQITELVTEALEALKGLDITVIDISEKSSIADAMMVATGTSKRHVSSLAESVPIMHRWDLKVATAVIGCWSILAM